MAAQTPNTPIVDYPHQTCILDTLIVERTSSKLGTSAPREPGAPYRKQGHSAKELSAFSGMLFLGQKASADDEWQSVFYGTNPQCQDIYNFAISYVAESNSHPTFARSYLVKRDDYFTTRPAKGSAFTGVFIVQVTAGGAGYTAAPAVVFTGGGGTGATAIAILDNNGAVSKVTLKTEGSGFTSAPAISFTGGGGTGAAATAYIQAAGCILVEEKTGDAPMPYGSLYITAMRIYKTLPGPELARRGTDEFGNPIAVYRQPVVANQAVPALGSAIHGNLVDDSYVEEGTTVEGTLVTSSVLLTTRRILSDTKIDPNTLLPITVDKELVLKDSVQGGVDIPFNATITAATVAAASVIATNIPHGVLTGEYVTITGNAATTPAINGAHLATYISATSFSIPLTVTSVASSGSGGTARRNCYRIREKIGGKAKDTIITSKVNVPDLSLYTQTFTTNIDYPWPDILTALTAFEDSGSGDTVPSGTFEHTVSWAFNYSTSGGVAVQIKKGPRNSTPATVVRTFSFGPPAAVTPEDTVRLSVGMIMTQGSSHRESDTYNVDPEALIVSSADSYNYGSTTIPPVITNGFGPASLAGSFKVRLPPSTPEFLISGNNLVIKNEPQQLALFIFATTKITAIIPNYDA